MLGKGTARGGGVDGCMRSDNYLRGDHENGHNIRTQVCIHMEVGKGECYICGSCTA